MNPRIFVLALASLATGTEAYVYVGHLGRRRVLVTGMSLIGGLNLLASIGLAGAAVALAGALLARAAAPPGLRTP